MANGIDRRGFIQLAAAGAALTGNFGAAAEPSETATAITRQPAPDFSGDLNTADILIETLIVWGATNVFGVVGDGINSLIEALRRRQDRIRYVGVRHEEAAAFMASGYAKHTGRLGVCIGTTGPGAIHLLNGLYDACFDGAPVVALTGTTCGTQNWIRYAVPVGASLLLDPRRVEDDVVTQLEQRRGAAQQLGVHARPLLGRVDALAVSARRARAVQLSGIAALPT